ncbi:MAG: DUF2203 domain-containing protein [Thermoplasmatota archaeon]
MRVWTLPEANAALPKVREMVEEGRRTLSELRDVEAQVDDLQIVYGDDVTKPSHPNHAEAAGFAKRREELMDEMAALSLRFQALGCDVKDLDQGLVDFRGRIGEEYVSLCWKHGEPSIRFWHTLQGGFANRQPIPGGEVGSSLR